MNRASIRATVLSMVAKRIASRRARRGRLQAAGLHDRGVQVEVVRHHRGAEDADRDVEHRRVGDHSGLGMKPAQNARRGRAGDKAISTAKQPAMIDEQTDHEGFQVAEPAMLQHQDQQDIQRGQAHAPDQRQSEQELQRDRGADHFGEVAGDDRQLARHP